VLMIGASLLMITILILTQSREGYISLTLTLPMLILIGLPSERRLYGLAVLTFLAIILGVILALHWGTVRTWIVGNGVSADSAFSLDSLSARLEIWSNAFYGIQDFPFTGMGMNIFRKEMPLLYPLVNISPEMDIGHAHNEFLQAGLDLGIPGLIAFIALYIITFWMLIRTWKCMRINLQPSALGQGVAIPSTKPRGRFSVIDISPFVDTGLIQMVVLGLGVGLLAHMLWGLTDAMALGARPAFIFWILLGLISGLHQQAQERWAVKDNSIFSKRPANGLGK
jgi:hypothetical protein